MTTRHALVVGIDHYPVDPLNCCVNDALAVAVVLSRHSDGSANFRVVTQVSSEIKPVTRDDLLGRIGELFSQSSDSDLVLYFSGHGRQTLLGPELQTYESDDSISGVSMDQIAAAANRLPHKSLTIILDCCFSGAASQGTPDSGGGLAQVQLAKSAALLASSRADELSSTGETYSKFTSSVLDGLAGAAADVFGRVTPVGLHALVDATFLEDVAQEPVLRVYSDASVVLRHCTPQISREHLRQLSVVFEHQAVSEHLNTLQPPEMVPRLLPHVVGSQIALPDHEATQAFLRAGLVELRLSNPDGSGQLELRLSARGIHYLRLARDGAFG